MEERELVRLSKDGDKEAFAMLYGMYKDRLYRYAYYRLGSQPDAEDAVSNCVLSAFQQITKLRNEKAFAGWIFRILYASCCSVVKNGKNDNIDDYENSLFVDMHSAIEKTEIDEALDILKDDEKEIVLLSVVGGFTSREIASMTGFTSGAVRSKLSRSLDKMKKFLEG